MTNELRDLLIRALETDDIDAVRALIHGHPEFLNLPIPCSLLARVRTVGMAEQLLNLGIKLEAISEAWAPGFGTRDVSGEVARFLVERGATLTAHAAAGLGLVDHLAKLLAADPSLIDAKGGDGCTPLHFSRDIETAKLLLDHGARVDARDEDHDSTPAQWLIKDKPEVVRFLLSHNAQPDIFMAAALGDRDLAETLITANPACPAYRIGRMPDYPPIGHKGGGGTIYQWTLAFNSYPHQIALLNGHDDLFAFLYQKSDTRTRLLVSCVLARRAEAEAIAAANPGLISSLPAIDHELVARYCWETNSNYDAVKLMLDVGFPIAHPETSHGYLPLHNAAWEGCGDLVDLLIERGHPVDLRDPGYNSTALGYAVHCCTVAKRHPEGEYRRVVRSLIEAGCPWEDIEYPTGDAQIDEVLASYRKEG